MKAADVVQALAEAARERGGMPRRLLGGSDVLAFITRKVKDWLREVEAVTLHVEEGDPMENVPSDSFNGWLRDRLLGGLLVGGLDEAVVLLEQWRRAHNEGCRGRSLGTGALAAFARQSDQADRAIAASA
jgi:hypothetical protein